MRAPFSKHDGFVLLEVAIALVILGLLSGLLVQSTMMMQKRLQVRTTQERIEMAFSSLAAYVLRHNKLPLPEKPVDGNTYVGYLPYRDLGMPSALAKDGWGNFLIYAVDAGLTKTQTLIHEGAPSAPIEEEAFCEVTSMTLHADPSKSQSGMANTDPSAVVAVVLYSSAGAPLKVESLFRGTTLDIQESSQGMLRWVSRDVLMAAYGRHPCRQASSRPEGVFSDTTTSY